MNLIDKYSCEKCLFAHQGQVYVNSEKSKGQWARNYRDALLCTIRPPQPATKGAAAETGATHVCAMFTDRETGKQPLRSLLPEVYLPLGRNEGGADDGIQTAP